ncbi:lipase secretion chaperone [Burkholderia oklahomensis]|uniref:lipase secretion chaperone n=1 Tax=Burkholderia oklahomensis TaxID=342113 RepID=UPI0005DA31FF|nr:lipase secretion chaperone [Burkholderia oklahomensis]AJX35657.1 lipase chaperone [Burkholderia oklahomensis C6786]AOI48394.1 lipase chaperone [Burkholderia oklahomensis C6786]KUY53743.1 lipase chaperone [Burkholderia oklahomensis C6786]MBI0363453.1 lipase secretion chaperone [Burkholderia oklahomensis]SUY27571.1 Lipase modulator [Burkholderia oklahomensis]
MTGEGGIARRVALYGVAGVVAAGAVWYVVGAPAKHDAGASGVAPVVASSAPAAAAASADAGSGAGALPASLAGSSAPRLPLDARGHLAKARAVRDFFDYWLSAQNELSAAALDALVSREIAAQLDGTIAQGEALDVWKRYRAYLDQLAKLPDGGAPGNKFDLATLQLALDQRESIASRTLGDWSAPFFGDEQQRQRYDLARLKIMRDASLTDAQKAARLAALEQQLPLDQRAEQAREKQQNDAVARIAQLQKSGASPDEMRAQLAQSLGPQAADRVAKMQQANDAWRAKYDAYAAQRAQIDAQNLSPQDRDAQVAQLRQRYFTEPGEALRAASLDRGSAATQTQ